MKKHSLLMVLVIAIMPALLFAAGTKEDALAAKSREITVYAYDTFCSDWGAGPAVLETFEAETGIKLNLVSGGSSQETLSKAIVEKDNPVADVVIGISDDMASIALESGLFEAYDAPALKDMPDFIKFDPSNRLLPFDYGNFAFVYDTEKLTYEEAPHSLDDLLKPEFKDQFVIIDPRTSSVGLGLLVWTIEVYGEDGYLDWWKAAADNCLTIADGWSSAYGLFTDGEVPVVLSYTTSPVYHVMWEDTTRYQTLIFPEGHSMTIESLGLLASSEHKEDAKIFIDYMLSRYQKDLAVANSMYPAVTTTELPEAFKWALKPETTLSLDPQFIADNLQKWLKDWAAALV